MNNLLRRFILLFTLYAIVPFLNAQVPPPSACYLFSGNANDYSGNNHNGTVHGAVLAADRFGNLNSAYSFNGNNSYIDIGNLGNIISSDEISICFWAKADSFKTNSPFIMVPDSPNDRLNIHIHYNFNGTPSTYWDYGNIYTSGRISIAPVPYISQWEHYVFIASASQNVMKIYKNNVLQLTAGHHSAIINKNKTLSIGGNIGGSMVNCYFAGLIDDVLIYNQALTTAEISDIFSGSFNCLTTDIPEANSGGPIPFRIFPNPIIHSTVLSFSLSQAQNVSLKIVDVSGRLVSTLADKIFEAGEYYLVWNADEVNSGVYFLQFQSEGILQTNKLIVTK